MRMLLIAGLAFLAAPIAAAPHAPAKFTQPSQPKALDKCPKTTTYQAYNNGKVGQPRKLAELPGAHQFAAVVRKVNGCEVPLIVRYNVGG
jgi:hypothetical protein